MMAKGVCAVVLTLAAACARAPAPSLPAPKLSDRDYLRALQPMVPVAGVRVAKVEDNYNGMRGERGHDAIDIPAPRGTPVLAAVDGEILRVASNTLGGKTIYATDRAHRFVYYYAHLDRYAERTKVGARVRQGDVIGYVGTTGNAPKDIPHLHFQVMRMIDSRRWWEGAPLNPYGAFVHNGVAR
jgi:murein DD-endopeptidase MepM/ murein hydrolase activator NlpD